MIKVLIGDTTLAISDDTPRFVRDVAELRVHPGYYDDQASSTAVLSYNDIAVVVLSSPVDLTRYPNIKPACLPFCTSSINSDFAGKTAVLSGWGKIGKNKPYSSHLKEADVEVYPKPECYGDLSSLITPDMFCAGKANYKGVCSGDSGGPIVMEDENNNGYYSLIGVISGGNCQRGIILADVPHFMQDGWLQSQLTGLDTCPPPGPEVTRPVCGFKRAGKRVYFIPSSIEIRTQDF